jgi:hypothetical protein
MILFIVCSLILSTGRAGPVIIDGTDANDHGSLAGGLNQGGWLYMQSVLTALAPDVGNGNKLLVDIGTKPDSNSRMALQSAFDLSALPAAGWTLSHVHGASDVGSYLDGNTVGGANLSNTGILYLATAGLAEGDLTSAEITAINVPSRAVAINNFISGNGLPAQGGGLFAMGEIGNAAWGWLNTLVPGIMPVDVGGPGVTSNIVLTAAGNAAFPGLTNEQLAGADPWHNHFTGNLGGLDVLATAIQAASTRNIILGGQLGSISNQGPMVNNAETMANLGDVVSHTFTASDPNMDPLTWEFVKFVAADPPAIPPSFDPDTQQFVWDTSGSRPGEYEAIVRAADPSGLTDTGSLAITLVPAPSTVPMVVVALMVGLSGRPWPRRKFG